MNSLTTNAPHTDPIGRQIPSAPETWPRWTNGIWSGRTATMAASSALKDSWAMHHPSRTTGMLGASATITMPREPPARPLTIQGRRMPSGDAVRSLIRPKNGFATMASRAPARRQAPGWPVPVVPDQRVHLQGQGDQQGREEQQVSAHIRQRVQRDKTPSDPVPRVAQAPA